MTKTANYNLNQWDAADPIRREDFNADNAALDAAIAGLAGQIAVGSYAGDNSTSWRTIELGFPPRFVIISGQVSGASNDAAFLAVSGGSQATSSLRLEENGFAVRVASANYSTYPLTNQTSITYHYLAIR